MALNVPRFQPQVQEQRLPNIQADTQAPLSGFGGGAAAAGAIEAGQGLVTTGQKIVFEEKRKADDLAVKSAFSQATLKRNERMWDPKEGAFTRRGRDAFGVIDEYGKAYEKDLDDIEKGLNSTEQRAMFREVRQRQAGELNQSLQKHTFDETQKYAKEVTDSGLTNARNDAVFNFQTPGKVAESIDLQKVLIASHAEDHGLPAEWVKKETERAVSQTHAAVINRMLANGQDKEASEYFAGIKTEVTGPEVTAVEKSLEEGSRSGESFRLVDGYRKKGMGLSQMLQEARKIEDPKLREVVNERARAEHALQDLAKRDREEKMYLNAANVIEGGGTYEMIPPHVRAAMPLQMRENIKRYYQDKIEGKHVTTDLGVYQQVKSMLADPARRSEALKYNISKHMNEIERPRLLSLIDEQAGLRKGDSNTQKQLDGYRSDQQVVDSILAQAFGSDIRAKDGSEKSKRIESARDAIDRKVEEFAKEHKRRPTNEELRKIANGQMIEVVTDSGFIFDTKKRRFELKPGEEFEIEIPAADRAEITNELKRRKRPVTDQEILKWYVRAQSGK